MVELGSARAAPTEELLPRQLGSFILFDKIGRGGMADIYLARQKGAFGGMRTVVLKQILPELANEPGFARMLISEAKLAARLSHGNIVQVHDLGRTDGALYIAMEYVEGFDLHQLLARLSKAKLPLPREFAFFIVREVLRALDYAHRAKSDDGVLLGLVHRDVSPSNVLISFDGEVKLCDFGIARVLEPLHETDRADESRLITRARVAGKSAYMAPEHAAGQSIDARADVFAAGILLWELCAGRRLYKGTEEEMLRMASEADVPELPDRGLPEHSELAAIVHKALAKNLEDRYASAREFLNALEGYVRRNKLTTSSLKLGAFIEDNFGEGLKKSRDARERALFSGGDGERGSQPPSEYGFSLNTSPPTPSGVRVVSPPVTHADESFTTPMPQVIEGEGPVSDEPSKARGTASLSEPPDEPSSGIHAVPEAHLSAPETDGSKSEPESPGPASKSPPKARKDVKPASSNWLWIVAAAAVTAGAVALALALR